MSADKHDSELQRYLSGEMSQQERHAFERKALDDPFLQDAIEGAESIAATDFKADVEKLQSMLSARKSTFVWWRVAAVALLFVLGGWAVWMLVDNQPETRLAKKDDTSEEVEPSTAKSEERVEEQLVEEKLSEPVARIEPEQVRPAESEGAGAKVSTKPALQEEEPVLKEEIQETEMDYDFVADEVFEEVAANRIEEVEEAKEKVSGARAAAKKQSTADHNRSWFQTSSPLQQNRKVTGKVSDESGEGLPGVNVVVKGTTTGVTTDLDGKFELNAGEESTLVFSSIGMRAEEVEVGDQSTIDVYMEVDSQELQEVVVTGYGSFDNDPEGYVEAMPTMGYTEFKKYLEEELFYPEEAISQGIEGTVVLQLVISRTGNISNIDIKRELGYGCDEEAIRLIKEGPRWSPATRDGINIESKVRVRIKFELK